MKTFSMMMAGMMLAASSVSAWAGSADLSRQPLDKVAPYPQAEQGMTRQVIYLPPRDDEEALRVELLIGKTLPVDCNRQRLMGQLESKTLQGWGYDYLVMEKVSGPMGTLMACPDGQRHPAFVTVHLGDSALQRYNSKLPLVVYVPQGVQVKYRIWQAQPAMMDAQIK
ncbi:MULTISPECIES: serine protease inhibitor ecotin [Edwardsiella]|nr:MULTISPECIES: serine protease inhibitor ecotin [Edwardsiella]AKR78457.1 serine protease inhibitor ecotin [Edwardsiella sp. LADL05-105]KAB0588115.1 serine protease inhibitor ecotin [Edwardsiella anguillarum]UOU78205.1 serine protease inhibitor ecotin [Edwardsiella anguillarum]WHP79367.1 serine protease inhibitor ecotin [Edwardsiella anguillarum]WHP82973.1 serine protease inhibitor ecotin [Edwardsiella anguillarum]